MAETLSELVIKILGDTQNFNAEIKKAKKVTEESFGEIKNIITNSGLAVSGAGIAMGFLGKGFIDAASKAEQYRVTLFAVTKSQEETNRLMKDAYEYAKKTPFEVGEVVRATVLLKAMGLEVEKTRHLAANLASAFSKDGKADLAGAINAISKAMSGSPEGFEILRNQYGITVQELAKFGAATKDGTQMIFAQKGAIEQNAAALTKLINTKYGTAIELQSNTAQTAMSNFSDAIDRLKVAIGTEMLPTVTDWAKKLTDLVQGLEKMDPAVKNATAKILLFTPPLMIGSGLLASFVANVLQATAALNALNPALAASVGSFVAAAPAIAAVVIGLKNLADAYMIVEDAKNKSKQAEIQFEDTLERGMIALNKFFMHGKKLSKEEISDAIVAQTNLIEGRMKVIKSGNFTPEEQKAMLEPYYKELEMLRKAQAETTKEIQQQKKELQGNTSSDNIWTNFYNESQSRNLKESVKDLKEKNDLDLLSISQKRQYIALLREEAAVLTKQAKSETDPEKQDKLLKQAHQNMVTAHNEEKQLDTDLTKQKEDNRQKLLNNALNYLAHLKAMNQIAADEETNYLRRILQTYNLTASERQQIEEQLYQSESQIRRKKEDDESKANKKRVDEAKKTADEIAQEEAKRNQATATVQDEINRIMMSKEDYEILQIQKRISELRSQGVEEVKIKEWVKAQEQRLIQETQDEESKAISKTSDKLDELKRKFDSIQRPGGANSPLLTLEQVGLSSAMMFAGGTSAGQAAAGTSDKPNISLSSLLSQGGASSAAAMGMKAGAGSFNNNYTVQIGSIEVTGEQAKQVYESLNNLVSLEDLNRTDKPWGLSSNNAAAQA